MAGGMEVARGKVCNEEVKGPTQWKRESSISEELEVREAWILHKSSSFPRTPGFLLHHFHIY